MPGILPWLCFLPSLGWQEKRPAKNAGMARVLQSFMCSIWVILEQQATRILRKCSEGVLLWETVETLLYVNNLVETQKNCMNTHYNVELIILWIQVAEHVEISKYGFHQLPSVHRSKVKAGWWLWVGSGRQTPYQQLPRLPKQTKLKIATSLTWHTCDTSHLCEKMAKHV